MPAPKWIAMTPAQRITADLCPECGADFLDEDAQHHLDMHWDPRLLRNNPDSQANTRVKMLKDYIKRHQPKDEVA